RTDLEADDRGAARRDGDRLHAGERRRAEARAFVDVVEDLADDVERGGEIRAADPEEDPRRLARARAQRMAPGERADRAVEQEIFRPLRDQLLVVHLLVALRAERLGGVELALHDVELPV